MDWLSDFSSKLLATLIGVFVGMYGGFWVDRRKTQAVKKKEAEMVLSALRSELSRNFDLLNQMYNELDKNVIFYNLDLSTWQTTTTEQLASIRNYELVRRISSMYYEFQHLSRKVDVQFEMHYSACRSFIKYDELRMEIVKPIVQHSAQLQAPLTTLISDIRSEIGKLQRG